jgi:hypothetical protein
MLLSCHRSSNQLGRQVHEQAESGFITKNSYLDEYRYSDWFERAGLEVNLLQPAPAAGALQPGPRTSRDDHRSDTRALRSRLVARFSQIEGIDG